MDAYQQISSPQNAKIKSAIGLRDSKNRRKAGQFLIDGLDLILKAHRSGYCFDQIFVRSTSGFLPQLSSLRNESTQVFLVDPVVMDKLQYGERDLDVIAVSQTPNVGLELLKPACPGQSQTILVLDRMEKPGNLGAALRTADAAGVRAVLLSDPICDLWNPNAVRSSLGALFTVPLATGTAEDIQTWLMQQSLQIFTARVEGSVPYDTVNFREPHAIVVGNEAEGLGNRWLGSNMQGIAIPMLGAIDSLNASVSTAVLLYESRRQQSIQKTPIDL